MDDLISRQAVRRILEENSAFVSAWAYLSFEQLLEQIDELPTAEKKGKWVPHVLNEYTKWGSDCSECGEWYVVERRILGERYHYCPNCGARMEE